MAEIFISIAKSGIMGEYGEIQIKGFNLDYEDPSQKIVNGIDQIDIFALFDDKWIVIKKVTVENGVVHLVKKDGTSVGFEQDDPMNAGTLRALGQVTKAFKKHFEQYD